MAAHGGVVSLHFTTKLLLICNEVYLTVGDKSEALQVQVQLS